ncbi:metal ABC transporter solute-binding protein, Zn/Mn family [uncultured Sphaerochaeta sp.]|uniref:metal ABC transporter solute-binding protein, Zn/Mn family n=1 Tax=uncultured Sphaerochaeta sp. TaxID=886478 RepID=UPI002A0A19E8|nr:zinc ABC transporter substrate-binding protein [uncultured Sphaerochaeta sp.]
MKQKIRIVLAMSFFLAVLPGLFANGTKEVASVSEKPMIAVSILPQKYFVDRIAGSLVDVVVLVGEGQDPHSYEPTPLQMTQLAKASCWILSKTDFELSLQPKIASLYPKLDMIDGTEGVNLRYLEHHVEESGEDVPQGTEIDRHTWLGLQGSLVLAGHIKDSLVALLPQDKALLEKNYEELVSDIQTTFTELKASLAPLKGRTVFVYHPAFGYLLDDLGMIQEAVETGGKEPTAKALGQLIAQAKADKAAVIFVQAQFPVNAAETVAKAVGAKVVSLDPLAENWLDNIHLIGNSLLTALEPTR